MYAQFPTQESRYHLPEQMLEGSATWFEDDFLGVPDDDALSTGFSCSSEITEEGEVMVPLQSGHCSSPQPETKIPNIVTPVPTSISCSDNECDGDHNMSGTRGTKKRTISVAQFNTIPERRNFSWSGLKLSKDTVQRLDMKLKLLEKSDCTRPTLAPIAKRAKLAGAGAPSLPDIITVIRGA